MISADVSLQLRNIDVASQQYCYPVPRMTPQPTPPSIEPPINILTPPINHLMVTGTISETMMSLRQTETPFHSPISTPSTLFSSNLSRTVWAPPGIATETPVWNSSASAELGTSSLMLWLSFLGAMAVRWL
ncbi:hypothetical protein FPOAC2_13437 [Fusarium poae]